MASMTSEALVPVMIAPSRRTSMLKLCEVDDRTAVAGEHADREGANPGSIKASIATVTTPVRHLSANRPFAIVSQE